MEIKQKKVWLSLIVLYAITTSVLGDFGEPLLKGFYKESCPLAEEIVKHNIEVAVLKDPRMAASLLRLQFHDCFVLVRKSSLSTLLTSSFVRFYNCSLRDDNFIKYF
jgi:peroxidase